MGPRLLGACPPATGPINTGQTTPPEEPPAARAGIPLTAGQLDIETTGARRRTSARPCPALTDAAKMAVVLAMATAQPCQGLPGPSPQPRPLLRVLVAGA